MSCFSSESIKMLLVANNKVSETMRNCSVIRGRKYRVGWDSEWEVQQLLGVLRVQVFFTLTLVWLGLVLLTDWLWHEHKCHISTWCQGEEEISPKGEKKKSSQKGFQPIFFVFYWPVGWITHPFLHQLLSKLPRSVLNHNRHLTLKPRSNYRQAKSTQNWRGKFYPTVRDGAKWYAGWSDVRPSGFARMRQ